METIKIFYTQIESIENDELTYLDDSGKHVTISFIQCQKNFVDYINQSDDYDITDLTIEKSKCICWRDICGKPMFFEFFSTPRLKIIFPPKNGFLERIFKSNYRKNHDEFRKLYYLVIESGWGSYDLS